MLVEEYEITLTWRISYCNSYRFLSILKCLLNCRNLAVSVLVDFFFCKLLFHRHTNPKYKTFLGHTEACRNHTVIHIYIHYFGCRNLLDFHFLIGNAISVKLSWNIFCLSHPWDHFGMLLWSYEETVHVQKPNNQISQKDEHLVALPLWTGWSLDIFFQQLFIGWIQQYWKFTRRTDWFNLPRHSIRQGNNITLIPKNV